MARWEAVERAAQWQYTIKKILKGALEASIIVDKTFAGGKYANFWELFRGEYGDRFHDAQTMIDLGAAIEIGLRDYYMEKKGYTNLTALRADPLFKRGIFQRIMPNQTSNGTAAHIFSSIGIDLHAMTQIREAQETMLHRHLYAHNVGLIDDQYMTEWKALTGEDLLPVMLAGTYPAEDIYWFRPLVDLPRYIEALRRFSQNLP